MVKTDKLKKIINQEGYSISEMAKKLDITPTSLYRKLNRGGVGLSIEQVSELVTILDLTYEDIIDIFFYDI